MAYRDEELEEDEAYLDAREDPDESDMDADEESETLPCPFCKEPVYESAEVCPHCGSFISPGEANRKPWWVVAVVAALLVVILLCWVRYA